MAYRPKVEVLEPPAAFRKAAKMMSWIPGPVRNWLGVMQARPKEADRPRDLFEDLKEDPYTVETVVEGKVWKVGYKTADGLFVTGEGVSKFKAFVDLAGEEARRAVQEVGEDVGAGERVAKDLERWDEVRKVGREEGKAGAWARAGHNVMNMFVVRLNGGGVLLYSPVLVRDGSSLDGLIREAGDEVKWIVMASSYHTLYMPSIVKRYPEARLVGSGQGSAKLRGAVALPRGRLDYEVRYGDTGALEEANKLLGPEGVTLHYLEGTEYSETEAAHLKRCAASLTIVQL